MGFDFSERLEQQRKFFDTGRTMEISFRENQLKRLLEVLKKNEKKVLEVLSADLARPEFESIAGEIEPLYQEIKFALQNLRNWVKSKHLSPPRWSMAHLRSSCRIHPEPFGLSLIISPWNYPFCLSLVPVVGAIAAGNCIVLKPSELSQQSSQLLTELISNHFSEDYFSCVPGDASVSQALLSQKFDFIFFTGGSRVGKLVMKAAAEHLTPVALELGGKSPALLDPSADLEVSLKRILWAKFFNGGQTCVSPDYLLVPEEKLNRCIHFCKSRIEKIYLANESWKHQNKIINRVHLNRLAQLLEGQKVLIGGDQDEGHCALSPCLVENPSLDSPLMKEEIFGPILPILSYRTLDDVLQILKSLPKPLAFYIFTKPGSKSEKLATRFSAGGVVINDCMIHLTNPKLPFGGVGQSGFGAYHGVYGFQCFSHFKSIEHKGFWPDFKWRYPPYKSSLLRQIRRFL